MPSFKNVLDGIQAHADANDLYRGAMQQRLVPKNVSGGFYGPTDGFRAAYRQYGMPDRPESRLSGIYADQLYPADSMRIFGTMRPKDRLFEEQAEMAAQRQAMADAMYSKQLMPMGEIGSEDRYLKQLLPKQKLLKQMKPKE